LNIFVPLFDADTSATESLFQTPGRQSQCLLAIMWTYCSLSSRAIFCRGAIDLSHDEESVLSAYGDHEGG